MSKPLHALRRPWPRLSQALGQQFLKQNILTGVVQQGLGTSQQRNSSKAASDQVIAPAGVSQFRKKKVNVLNDDGSVQWGNLSSGEKVARTTQQTFNLGIIVVGCIGTGLVAYYLYQEVLSPDSKTVQFNRAVDRIRQDAKSLELLGDRETIKAFGEPSLSKWTRSRPLAATVQHDSTGLEHFHLKFHVQGSQREGTVLVHLVRRSPNEAYTYRSFILNVPGFPSHYLEREGNSYAKSAGFRMLGIQWR